VLYKWQKLRYHFYFSSAQFINIHMVRRIGNTAGVSLLNIHFGGSVSLISTLSNFRCGNSIFRSLLKAHKPVIRWRIQQSEIRSCYQARTMQQLYFFWQSPIDLRWKLSWKMIHLFEHNLPHTPFAVIHPTEKRK
jgi:hypothetical protein